MTLFRCSKCGMDKEATEFHRSGGKAHGRHCYCKPCAKQYTRDYRAAQVDRTERKMLSDARQRAKKKGLPFSITLKDVVVPALCPVFGTQLTRGVGVQHDGSPTLDRINSSLGYVPGNVHVISSKANRMKSNATPEELVRLAQFFRNLDNGYESPQSD